jgi:S1-C subfamily serine protease
MERPGLTALQIKLSDSRNIALLGRHGTTNANPILHPPKLITIARFKLHRKRWEPQIERILPPNQTTSFTPTLGKLSTSFLLESSEGFSLISSMLVKLSVLSVTLLLAMISGAQSSTNVITAEIPINAPITSEAALNIISWSVFPVVTDKGRGTGFFHRSGNVITAQHVISNATVIIVRTPAGDVRIHSEKVKSSEEMDLALLIPETPIKGEPLPLSTNVSLKVGSSVITWGYPGGYTGAKPLLCAGVLGGVARAPNGLPTLVVNAAFNAGNSGGPLLDANDGSVAGVVISKMAPLPVHIQNIFTVLKNQGGGIGGGASVRMPDGRLLKMQHELIAEVLEFLRSQTQLVVGYAVNTANLRIFLEARGIDP